jgi:hypothetical protein
MMPQAPRCALGVGVRRAGIVASVATIEAKGRFDRRPSPPGRATYVPSDGGAGWIDVVGWLAGDLPKELQDPCFESLQDEGGRWRLTHGGGACEFVAAGVSLFEPAPELIEPLGAPFALKSGERRAARVLLALLRLPGGARLLRAWHARRG